MEVKITVEDKIIIQGLKNGNQKSLEKLMDNNTIITHLP